MKICMIGTGYVGLVTGACFAEMGNNVICVDENREKIDILNQGGVPIYEPGLKEIIQRNVDGNRLSFTTDFNEAVSQCRLCFIAVGTPQDKDGTADLKYVLRVAAQIGSLMEDYKIIIDKSTVPVGTADRVREVISGELAKRG
ncbi:MAG TPA: 2-dehydropantoate 2-reductase N-terminal domain-containing protein, partial [Deltaproteobacteria bacterium]|nr:2-dehydropantoate 2-reductase N-terminal domain-containing protein [Deltaproteobacteria bacterium]